MSAQAPTGLSIGTHTLGPANAKLTVRTGRSGAIAKVGHDLLLEVTAWSGTLEVSDGAITVALTADSSSLKVLSGSGGMQALGEDDIANINQTIDDDVLAGGAIAFHSTDVTITADGLRVDGDLELLGASRPVAFDLTIGDDGRLTGEAVIKQTDFGIKPYSTLFGTLKVADEVRVAIEGVLPTTTEEQSNDG
jgi:polyisoprenoid-binding protein YceI